MIAQARRVGWGLTFMLARRARTIALLATGAGVVEGFAARRLAGPVEPGGPLAGALALTTLIYMAGGIATDFSAGRGELYLGAARSGTRLGLCDVGLRVGGVLVLSVAVVSLAALGGAAGGGPEAAFRLVRAWPFLALSALALAGLAHAFGNLSADLGMLYAAIWAFPVSLVAAGLALADGSGWTWWLWLCFPVDALAALAPANAGSAALMPGPDPYLRVAVFTGAAWACGTLLGIIRSGPYWKPAVRPERPRRREAASPPPR